METKGEFESIENYQITHAQDIDFLKIIEILKKKNKEDENLVTKRYVHSLFTPLLSYIIDYLNNNNTYKDKDELNIGKSKIYGISIAYAVLNKKIYDLFFRKKRGQISNNEINYDFKTQEENYSFDVKKNQNPSCKKTFKKLLSEGLVETMENVEIQLQNGNINKIFELKKKEIISMFRIGYSIQERIINHLNNRADKIIIELPNIIFFHKNTLNKLYSEIDRIITVKEETIVKDFLIYLKAKVKSHKKQVKIREILQGETLKFNKDSCYFIEVKTSINSIMGNEEKETINQEDKKVFTDNKSFKSDEVKKNKIINKNKSASAKSGINYFENSPKDNSESKRKIKNIHTNMETFKKLFDNLGKHFESLNLVIIIDSYFPKNFIEQSKRFVEIIKEEEFTFDCNIYFVHFEMNYEYVQQIKESEEFRNSLMEKDAKILNLETNAREKDAKILNLETNDREKDAKILNLENQIHLINSDFSEMRKKLRLISMKSKIQDEFEELIETKAKEYIKGINAENKDNYYIIAQQKLPDFNCSKKIKKIINKNIQNILDFKTFCKTYYKPENKDLIDIIKQKHSKNIKKYFEKNEYEFLLFLVDFVFLYSLKELLNNISNYNITVESSQNNFFIVKFKPKKDKSIKSTCLFEEEILGTDKNNLFDFIDLKNFTDYYLETSKNKDKEDLEYYPIYNPITDKCDSFLSIEKTNDLQATHNLVLIVEPIYEYGDLNFEFEKKYKYRFIVFKNHNFSYDSKIIENIPVNFTFGKDIQIDCYSVGEGYNIYENEYKYIKVKVGTDVANIFDKKEERLQYKYLIDKNLKFDKELIFDGKIEYIMDKISKISESIKKNKLNILIEEPFNLIYTYIKAKNIKCDIVLLNNSQNKEINEFLTTNIDTKNTDTNLYSYLNTIEENQYFDFIILQNNSFPDEDNDVIPKNLFLEDKIINKISSHLNKGGKFCFNLLLKNQFLGEKYEEKIEQKFENVDIYCISDIDEVIICSDAKNIN